MKRSRPPCPLHCPSQTDINMLLAAGVEIMTLVRPWAMKVAFGQVGQDRRFEPDQGCDRWFAFEDFDVDDIILWRTSDDALVSFSGRAFALGEAIITQAETYSFDCRLNVFASPLRWLQARRDGIVILQDQWPLAFDRLRDVPRVAIEEALLPLYRRHMRPAHLPELYVIPEKRTSAA